MVEQLLATLSIRVQFPSHPFLHFMWNRHFSGDFEATQLELKKCGFLAKQPRNWAPRDGIVSPRYCPPPHPRVLYRELKLPLKWAPTHPSGPKKTTPKIYSTCAAQSAAESSRDNYKKPLVEPTQKQECLLSSGGFGLYRLDSCHPSWGSFWGTDFPVEDDQPKICCILFAFPWRVGSWLGP